MFINVHLLHLLHSMNNEYRYSLASNKFPKLDCPRCGAKKHWQRYYDKKTGEVLPEEHGRCDNEDKCREEVTPKDTGYAKAMWAKEHGNRSEYQNNLKRQQKKPISKPDPKTVFFDFDTFKQTLQSERYNKNTFVQNLFNNVPFPFAVDDVTKVIQLYRLGTSPSGATCFPFIDTNGNVSAIQEKYFDNTNSTDKSRKYHTSWTHTRLQYTDYFNKPLPKWLELYIKQDMRISCLFAEHLLSLYPNNPVAFVESPKTAVYCTLYFGLPNTPDDFIWLAVGAKGWLNFEKVKVLQGRFVYVFPDLSKDGDTFKEWQTKAYEYESRLPRTRFILSDLLEQLAPERDKSEGSDIADYLIKQDWREYRKKNIQEPVPKPEPKKGEGSVASEAEKTKIFTPVAPIQKSTKYQEPQNEDWDNVIKEFEIIVSNNNYPLEPIKLKQGGIIFDIPLFIQSHLTAIKANKGNDTYLPYLNRLLELKEILSTQ
jgi:hypothetical protein